MQNNLTKNSLEKLTMDLIIVTDSLISQQPLLPVAEKMGHRVVKYISFNDDVSGCVTSMHPDVLIIICSEVDKTILHEMKTIGKKRPTPILAFTEDNKEDSIMAAVKAGASAYVVGCDDPERLDTLLGVAKARFSEQQRLTSELQQTKDALLERKNVEKAKGIIMKTKSLSEDQAYNALRKLAMNNNKRIGDIANQIIAAAEVLV